LPGRASFSNRFIVYRPAKKGKKEEEVQEVQEEKDPLELTEEEIYLKRMSDEANVDLLYLSDE
jgi:hypothetical protein